MKIKNHLPGIIIAVLIFTVAMYYSKQHKPVVHINHSMAGWNDIIGQQKNAPGKIICQGNAEFDPANVISEPEWIKRKELGRRYNVAMAYLVRGEYKKCADVCKELINKDPEFSAAYAGLAFCQMKLGNLDSARHAYLQQRKLEKSSNVALVGLGAVASLQDRHEQSIAYYQQAIDRCPDDALPHWSIAGEYYRVKNYKRAAEEYETFIGLSNNSKDIATARRMLKEINVINGQQ